MPEKLVSLAIFSNPIEAQEVWARLDASGIPAVLVDAAGVPVFPGSVNAFGKRELLVAKGLEESAGLILKAYEDEVDEEDERHSALPSDAPNNESPTEIRTPLVSPLEDRNRIPAEGEREVSEDAETAPTEELDDEREKPALLYTPDDFASRAFRSALLGYIMCPGFMHLYALWLLIRLAFVKGNLSRAGVLKAYGALALSLLPLLIFERIWMLFVLP